MSRFGRISFLFLLLAAASSLMAANEVGIPKSYGSAVEWQVKISDYAEITLTVLAVDGEVYVSSFPYGKNPAFSLRELPAVEDGEYNYDLRVTPKVSSTILAELKAARASGDDRKARAIMRKYGLDKPLTQTGGFRVVNGSIVTFEGSDDDTGKLSEPRLDSSSHAGTPSGAGLGSRRPDFVPAVNDHVIPDDLIVQGSECVGFDCVNGEAFDADTIRLKENNLRIHFDDTSTVSGFPANDWRLIANDRASGGQNKFSIEDSTGGKTPFTVEADASTNAIYADSTGRIGFRTSTPVLDLHTNTSNTPAIRLEQNNSGGFSAQTWDIGANEANFFVRDVTNGSRLSFRIRPGAPTSSIDIASDGDVGIGTNSPQTKLHVFSDAVSDAQVGLGPSPGGATGPGFFFSYSGAGIGRGAAVLNTRPDASAIAPNPSIRFLTGDTQRMIIDNEGFIGLSGVANPANPIQHSTGAALTAAGTWADASSRELKENINELSTDDARNALLQLKAVTYNYKAVADDPKVGFIAEDVPAIVAMPDHKTLSALEIVGVLTKVVQDQQKTIDELTKRLEAVEQKDNQ
jgi:Chaperone of endosialidase